ncbi:MAG: Flagellar brake protein YcgR [Candidatus Dichloromethanomonas elyunquensis]|nr:MAG: Flagellar brake protein YcgR [Candidatus Dichloromethanomonas elyunquensis]
MLYEEKIYEGVSVELVVYEGEYKGKYRTRIEEVGKRILSVGVPVVDGQFIPLREGTRLNVIFADELSAYSFSSSIIKRIALPIPTFIIEFPNKIEKIQRRKFVRVPLIRSLKYRIIEKEGISDEKSGYMIDLSGGGLLFNAQENLPSKAIILLKTLIGTGDMEIPGIVIRSQREDGKDLFKVSVQFYEISEKTRDKIIQYVFEIQREMRKKGLV